MSSAMSSFSIPTVDAELPSLPGQLNDGAELTRNPSNSSDTNTSAAATSSQAARLMEEVESLMSKHRVEVKACFDNWLRNHEDRFESSDHPKQLRLQSVNSVPFAEGCRKSMSRVPSMLSGGNTAPGPPKFSFTPTGLKRLSQSEGTGQLGVVTRNRRKTRKVEQELFENKIKQVLQSQSPLQRIFSSRYYEWGSGLLILMNAIFMGYQTQYNAEQAALDAALDRTPAVRTPGSFVATQVIFTVLFGLELSLRWVSEGLIEFFQDTDKWWNMLDVLVVALGCLDLIFESFIQQTAVLQNISVLRVLRVIRVVRVARVIRIMKFFRELRMMIFSILGSMKSLVWVMLVLLMTFYVFGITFTAATTSELDTNEKWRAPETEDLRNYFGTLDRSLLSLFMAMSGGNDWGSYYQSITVLPAPYQSLFLLFISFCVFAVVNIVTGVFVESAMQSNSKDRDIIVHEELETKKDYLSALREIFEDIDDDDSGAITLEEFEHKLDDEKVIAYFNALKLDVSDARTLFWLLDFDRSDEVNIDEFLTGCYKLQGESRNMDMKLMQCEMHSLKEGQLMLTALMRELMVTLKEPGKKRATPHFVSE